MNRFNELTDLFLAADKVVLANPMWSLNVPTKVKAWVDTINVAGKTFRYSKEGDLIGLAGDKKFFHIQAIGSTYGENQPASQWLKAILGFCGIINITFVYIDGLDAYPEKREEILNRAYSEIENKVIDF